MCSRVPLSRSYKLHFVLLVSFALVGFPLQRLAANMTAFQAAKSSPQALNPKQ